MLLDRTHRTWATISAIIMIAATVSYVIYAESTPKGPSGGSLMGLLYGVVGSLMMIYAGLLGGRKQFPFWRLGSAQFWLRGHLWFGTLSFPIILFHAGFELGGVLEQVLMGFFFVVWISGFFGLAMQHFMPKLLSSRVSRETHAVQIPYIRKRNRILADKIVSVDCGPVPLDGDPMQKDLTRLGKFAADILTKEKQARGKAEKEEVKSEKATWLQKLPADDEGLFRDLARHAKSEGWINKEDNFPDQIVSVYEIPGYKPAAKESPKGGSTAKAGAGSPLDQMKAKKKAGSPLDQIKAKQAMSPLEQMKAKQAAKAAGQGADSEEKPKAMSPLELARQAGAAGSGGAKAKSDSGDKKLSPLELARQMGAAGSGGMKKAAIKSDATPEKAPLKKVAPAKTSKKPDPVPMVVDDVEAEVSAVQKLLTEKYGYEAGLATSAANKTREFLKADLEKDVAAVKDVLTDKYGYDEQKATDIAEKVRPFVDDSAQGETADGAASSDEPARAPAKPAAAPAGRKLSPLEMARQMGAAGSGGGKKAESTGESDKPLSPLEQIKAKAAGKKKAAEAPGGDKPKSPLEMIKAKAAAGKADGGDKPKSPLELMKAKAGGGGAAAKKKAATKKAPAPPAKKKPVAKRPVLRTDELRSFYLKTVRPFLIGNGKSGRLADVTEASRAFTQMRGVLPVELHDTLETLQAYCEEHRQFAEQLKFRAWLHYWLAIHIPFSIALFVLFVAHVVLALRVVPWDFPVRL